MSASAGVDADPALIRSGSLHRSTIADEERLHRLISRRGHDVTEILPELTTRWVCVSTAEGHVGVVDVVARQAWKREAGARVHRRLSRPQDCCG